MRRVRERGSLTASAPIPTCSASNFSFLCANFTLHACATSFCVVRRSANNFSADGGRVVGRPRPSVLTDPVRKRFDSVGRAMSRASANAATPPRGTSRLSMKAIALVQSALAKSAAFFPGAPTAAKKSAFHTATTEALDMTRASENINIAMMYMLDDVARAANTKCGRELCAKVYPAGMVRFRVWFDLRFLRYFCVCVLWV